MNVTSIFAVYCIIYVLYIVLPVGCLPAGMPFSASMLNGDLAALGQNSVPLGLLNPLTAATSVKQELAQLTLLPSKLIFIYSIRIFIIV